MPAASRPAKREPHRLVLWLKDELRKRGILDKQIADACGLNRSIIFRWFTGDGPSIATFEKVLTELGYMLEIALIPGIGVEKTRTYQTAADILAMIALVEMLPLAEATALIRRETGESLSYSFDLARNIQTKKATTDE